MAQIGGGGGKRDVNFELNLVPFIDLMSVMITFLLITAVWSQVAMIKLGSSIYGPSTDNKADKQPKENIAFRLDVKDTGYYITIGLQKIEVPKVNNEYDKKGLYARIKQIKSANPDKTDCVITVAEALKYERLIEGMDLLLRGGFPSVSIATGGAK